MIIKYSSSIELRNYFNVLCNGFNFHPIRHMNNTFLHYSKLYYHKALFFLFED